MDDAKAEDGGTSKGVRDSQAFKGTLDSLQKSGRRGSVLEKLLNKHDSELENRLARSNSDRRTSLQPRNSDDSGGDAKKPASNVRRASMSIVIDRRGSASNVLDMSPTDSGSPVRGGGPRRPSLGEQRVRRASTDRALDGTGASSPTNKGADADPLSMAAREHRMRLGNGNAGAPGQPSGTRASDELRRPSIQRRTSSGSIDGGVRERRRSRSDIGGSPPGRQGSAPHSDDPALEIEYLRLQNEDLASALRSEQNDNAELRKRLLELEKDNQSLRDYMNDRLV